MRLKVHGVVGAVALLLPAMLLSSVVGVIVLAILSGVGLVQGDGTGASKWWFMVWSSLCAAGSWALLAHAIDSARRRLPQRLEGVRNAALFTGIGSLFAAGFHTTMTWIPACVAALPTLVMLVVPLRRLAVPAADPLRQEY